MAETPIIQVRPAPFYRLCSACFASADLIEIAIGTTTHNGAASTCVVLCAGCRRTLVDALYTTLTAGPEGTLTAKQDLKVPK